MAGFCYLCSMKLHIFNPEHDLALAANQSNYTAPHAGRQLRNDLSFIPALWADQGDFVLVDDIDSAYDKLRHFGEEVADKVEFVTKLQLEKLLKDTFLVDRVHPWGWDRSLVFDLKRLGCPEIMLPTDETLGKLREISGRQWAAAHLQKHVTCADSVEMVFDIIKEMDKAVVKSPWSCSGRGVRYVTAETLEDAHARHAFEKWVGNTIRQQSCVTIEPYYNKVKDFGMEFEVKDGNIAYLGLSLFQTVKNAYTGNVLATEDEKQEMMSQYVSENELKAIRQHVIDTLQPVLKEVYSGPFGVDMMVCRNDDQEIFVNPCIELNLRRTMGHVALALSQLDKSSQHLMQVDFDGNRYHLRVLPSKLNEE